MNQISNKSKAFLWMLGTTLSFCSMALCIKELSINHSTFDIQSLRNIFCIFILLIPFLIKKKTSFKTLQMRNNLFRNFFHFIGQSGWTFGLSVLPMSTVFSIEFTMPIWGTFIAVLFLKEKINSTKLIFLLIGLIGTVIILSPSTSSFNEYAIIVLAAAISYAIAHNFTKILTKTDSIISILFWMSLIQLPLSIFCGIFYGGFKLLYFSELPLILIFSATSLLAHLCLAKSLKLADASFVLPLDYIRLPIITAIGWYMYSENISLNIIIGSLFIIISSIISLKRN